MPRTAIASALPALLGSLPALALFVVWSAKEGGYDPTVWYPGGLLLVGLTLAAWLGAGHRRRPLSRPTATALILFGLYVAWSYASISWAQSSGDALEGANRTLLYWLAFASFVVLPWEPIALLVALVAVIVAITALGVDSLVRAVATADPDPFFINARFAEPVGYQNGNALLWTIGAAPALLLAAQSQMPRLLRPPLLVASGFLVELALLSQSRTWLYTLPLIWLIALAATRERLRLVVATLAVGAATLVAAPALLDVYSIGSGGQGDRRSLAEATSDLAHALDAVPAALALSAAGLLLAGTAIVLVEGHISVPRRWRAAATRRTARIAAAVIAGAALAGVAVDGRAVDRVDQAFEQFRSQDDARSGDTRFGSLGSSRYDFYRVSLLLWREHPVLGLGQDNFSVPYLTRRRSYEEPRWTHSVLLRALVHTGAIGLLLLLTATFSALVAAARRLRAAPEQQVVVAAALLPFAAWAVAGSFDWFWELPALSAFAFALLGAACVVDVQPASPHPRPARAWPVAALGCGAAAIAALLFTGPWLAARDVRRARLSAPADAIFLLDRAASLNPLSVQPHLTRAALAIDDMDLRAAEPALRSALEMEPDLWLVHLELGLTLSQLGDRRSARRAFEDALALNPREPLVREALARLATKPLTLIEANTQLRNRALARVAR